MSYIIDPAESEQLTHSRSEKKNHRLAAILVVCASMLFLLYKYILQISPSVMVQPLMITFHLNGFSMGMLTASWFWSMLLFQFIAGPILDRYPVRWVSVTAIVIAALGALAFSQSTTLSQAVWSRSIMGVGVAFATVSYLKLTADWFTGRRYAIVSGLLITGVMLGSLLAQSPLTFLVTHFGWKAAVFDCAMLGFAVAITYCVCVPSQSYESQQTPRAKQSIQFKDCLSVLTVSQNWWLMLYSGLAFTPLAAFGGLWGNSCLACLHHLTTTQTADAISCLFIGLGVGGPLLPWLSDKRLSRKNCMYFGLLLTFIGFVSVLYLPIHSLLWLCFSMFVAGFGTSAFMLGFGFGKDINALSLAATVVCLINTGDSVLGALTEPLLGQLLDFTGSPQGANGSTLFNAHGYRLSMVVLLLFLCMAAFCVSRLRDTSTTVRTETKKKATE